MKALSEERIRADSDSRTLRSTTSSSTLELEEDSADEEDLTSLSSAQERSSCSHKGQVRDFLAQEQSDIFYGPPLTRWKNTGNIFTSSWGVSQLRIRGLLCLEEVTEDNGWSVVAQLENVKCCSRFESDLILWTESTDNDGVTALKKQRYIGKNEDDAEKWRREIISRCVQRCSIECKKIDPRSLGVLSNFDVREENDRFRIGDIVLFRIKQFAANVQRAFTGSEFDHTAIVVPLRWGVSYYYGNFADEKWALLEATPDGVMTCPLSARLAQYKRDCGARICVRHLRRRAVNQNTADHHTDAVETLHHFVRCCTGQPYSYKKMLTAVNKPGYVYDHAREEATSIQGYFCSELCAIALSCLGAMHPEKQYGPTWYWPKAFTTGNEIDQHMNPSFSLTCEIDLIVPDNLLDDWEVER